MGIYLNVRSASKRVAEAIEMLGRVDERDIRVRLYAILDDLNSCLFPGEQSYPSGSANQTQEVHSPELRCALAQVVSGCAEVDSENAPARCVFCGSKETLAARPRWIVHAPGCPINEISAAINLAGEEREAGK